MKSENLERKIPRHPSKHNTISPADGASHAPHVQGLSGGSSQKEQRSWCHLLPTNPSFSAITHCFFHFRRCSPTYSLSFSLFLSLTHRIKSPFLSPPPPLLSPVPFFFSCPLFICMYFFFTFATEVCKVFICLLVFLSLYVFFFRLFY